MPPSGIQVVRFSTGLRETQKCITNAFDMTKSPYDSK